MCTPSVLVATGSFLQAQGQYQTDSDNQEILDFQEKATLQKANSESDALEAQAKENDRKAEEARKRGRFNLGRFRRQLQGELGETKTALAVTGVKITTGSSQRILADQTRAGVVDQLVLSQNNSLEVLGFKSRAEKFRRGAGIVRETGIAQGKIFGKQATAIGKVKGIRRAATILSGFGQAAAIEERQQTRN